MRQISIPKLNDMCLTAILSNKTPQELFDEVFEYIQVPMICFDVVFQCVAYHFPETFNCDSWREIAFQGIASDRSVTEGNYLSSQDKISSSREPVFFNPDNQGVDFEQYCCSVYTNNHLHAYVGLGLDNIIPVQVRDCCQLLATTLGLIISKDQAKQIGLEDASNMLYEFLKGDIYSSDIALFQQIHRPPYLLQIGYLEEAGPGTLEYVVSHMKESFPNTIFCISQGRIFGLSCNGDGNRVSDIATRDKVYKSYGLTVGISDWFFNISEIPLHHMQADLALSHAKRTGRQHISFEEDYLKILASATVKYYGKEASFSPYFQKILDLNEPWAVQTLESYFASLGRAPKAAEMLNIHKNTISNRIHKLETTIGESLLDPLISKTLIFDLKIYNGLEE